MSGSPSATTHVEPLLAAYHAGALSPAEAAQVAEHLRGCAACRERSEQVAIDQIIRAAPAPTVGPELRQRVYARIATDAERADTAASHAPLRDARPSKSSPLARSHASHAAQRGWLSGAVAALIVALLAGAFLALPHLRQQPNHASKKVAPKVTTACPASATTANLPPNANLNDMALTSPTEGWAVGAIQDNQGNVTNGLIMRFSACHWAPVNISLPGVALMHISMDSPTDGWASGSIYSSNTFVLLHDSNGAWGVVDTSQIQGNRGSVWALSMVSPDEGWIVTMGPDEISNSSGTVAGAKSRLWQDAQGSWTNIACPLPMIDAIAPVGPDDLWVAGSAYTGPGKQTSHNFAHYHDGAWTITPQPAGLWMQSLQVVSPTDIWASGVPTTGAGFVIAHYDGSAWSDASDELPRVVADGGGPAVALGVGEGWAFTFRAPSTATAPLTPPHALVGSVLRETGGQWRSLNWNYSDINFITTWAPAADGEVWAIGRYWVDGTPTSLPGGGGSDTSIEYTVLLHYANGAWSRYG